MLRWRWCSLKIAELGPDAASGTNCKTTGFCTPNYTLVCPDTGSHTARLITVSRNLIHHPYKCSTFTLTSVLRFPLPSLATDTDTEREKYLPGEALLGLLVTESWEPVRLRSGASPAPPEGMDVGLRVVCIVTKSREGECVCVNVSMCMCVCVCVYVWVYLFKKVTEERGVGNQRYHC